MTAAQGRQAKIDYLNKQIAFLQGQAGGLGPQAADHLLDLRGELADLLREQTQETADLTAEIKALKDEVKRQTDFAESVAATEAAAMARWVTEVISKQMGFGIGGRSQTPGYGVARRS